MMKLSGIEMKKRQNKIDKMEKQNYWEDKW